MSETGAHPIAHQSSLVLLIDEDAETSHRMCAVLRGAGHRVVLASSVHEARTVLQERDLAVVLLSVVSECPERLLELERLKLERPDVAIVITTPKGSVDGAMACVRRGAFDYLESPQGNSAQLVATVSRALAHRRGFESLANLLGRLGEPFEALAGSGGALMLQPTSRAACRPVESSASCELAELLDVASAALIRARWRAADAPVQVAPGSENTRHSPRLDVPLSLPAYEKLALERALRESGGDAADAAQLLGIGRSTFYRKAAKHGLVAPRAEGTRSSTAGAFPASHRGVGTTGSIG